MAGKFSRWFREERPPQRPAVPRLTVVQQSILHWLQRELRRRERAGEELWVPYPALVQGVGGDKVSLTNAARQLLRKDLLTVTLPPGAWVRYIGLTEEGAAHAKTLTNQQRHERRRP